MKRSILLLLAWFSLAFLPGVSGAQLGAAGGDYRLGPGDIVRISVYGNPDLTTEAQITQQNRISFPLIGEVQVGGIEKSAAEQLIARRLGEGGFVIKPQVNVLVIGFKSQQISVLGQVNRPGKYPIEQASTLADLLSMAGGISQTGGDLVTHISKDAQGKTVKRDVDVDQVLRGAEMERNLPVANGDIIYVPRAQLFYIYGEVNRPGAYRLERNMTVMQALSVGGGLNVRGTERGVRINRHAGGKVETLQAQLSDLLQENDVVFVRESLF